MNNNKITKNNGITLVALVVTIVILLILAGISISALTQTGLFGKAKQAEQKSNMADAKEKITLIEYEWQLESISNPEATLENFLNEKVADKTIDEYKKLDNGNYEVYVNGYVGTLESNGKLIGEVEKAGPRPTISNITIKSEDGSTDVADNSQKPGTKLQINFNSSIENGTIKSITPAVPYTTNGTETSKQFAVVGTVNGEDYTKTITVDFSKKYKNIERLTSEKLNVVLSTTENKTLQDEKGNIITVPAKFKIISDSTTNNATTVDKGIVVEDATGTATNGSQFVWVPVGTITKADGSTTTINLDRYTFADGEDTNIGEGTPTSQGEKVVENCYSETASKGNTVAKSITNFKNSVATNGGYYIGRYEARQKNGQITEVKTDTVWNNITQQTAADKAQKMYDNTYPFTSDLMNSYAWDTATLFAQSCGTNSKYSRQNSLNTDSVATTGTTNDVQCNIYDMASNVREWTTETSSIGDRCVGRGGHYLYSSDYTSRRSISTYNSYSTFGFRSLLYL